MCNKTKQKKKSSKTFIAFFSQCSEVLGFFFQNLPPTVHQTLSYIKTFNYPAGVNVSGNEGSSCLLPLRLPGDPEQPTHDWVQLGEKKNKKTFPYLGINSALTFGLHHPLSAIILSETPWNIDGPGCWTDGQIWSLSSSWIPQKQRLTVINVFAQKSCQRVSTIFMQNCLILQRQWKEKFTPLPKFPSTALFSVSAWKNIQFIKKKNHCSKGQSRLECNHPSLGVI